MMSKRARAPAPVTQWVVSAPFFTSADARWIDDFVVNEPGKVSPRFVKCPAPMRHANWHSKHGGRAAIGKWWNYLVHTWRSHGLARQNGGLITLFPQLALLSSLLRRITGGKYPIVAYCFNIGRTPGRLERLIGKWAFSETELFVVHSRAEIDLVSEWFAVPRHRVRFVPLQCGDLGLSAAVDEQSPYLLAMGSANRDYAALVSALQGLSISTVIVAAPRCLEGITMPEQVRCLNDLSLQQCRELASRASVNIVPLVDLPASSGQVTVVESMRMGVPVIATRTIGTVDYIADRETGLLVPGGDPEALAAAIVSLVEDNELRAKLARNAHAYALAELSDEAAARRLVDLLHELVPQEALCRKN